MKSKICPWQLPARNQSFKNEGLMGTSSSGEPAQRERTCRFRSELLLTFLTRRGFQKSKTHAHGTQTAAWHGCQRTNRTHTRLASSTWGERRRVQRLCFPWTSCLPHPQMQPPCHLGGHVFCVQEVACAQSAGERGLTHRVSITALT